MRNRLILHVAVALHRMSASTTGLTTPVTVAQNFARNTSHRGAAAFRHAATTLMDTVYAQ
jgi:hypothetical protein